MTQLNHRKVTFKYGMYFGIFLSINLAIDLIISSEKIHYLMPFTNLLSALIVGVAYMLELEHIKLTGKEFLRDGLWIGVIGSALAVCFFFTYTITIGKTYHDNLVMREVSNLRMRGYDEYDIKQAIQLSNLLRAIHFIEVSIFVKSLLKFFSIILILNGLSIAARFRRSQ